MYINTIKKKYTKTLVYFYTSTTIHPYSLTNLHPHTFIFLYTQPYTIVILKFIHIHSYTLTTNNLLPYTNYFILTNLYPYTPILLRMYRHALF